MEENTDSKSVFTDKDTGDNVEINQRMRRILVKNATICKVKPIVRKKVYQKKDILY